MHSGRAGRLLGMAPRSSVGLTVIVTAQVRLDDADVARQALDTKGRSIAEAIAFEVDPPRHIVVDFHGRTQGVGD